MKKTIPIVTLIMFFAIPSAINANAQSCGLDITNSTIDFGNLDRNQVVGDPGSNLRINLNNTGTVASIVTVAGTNWVSDSTIHIKGNYTTFATTDAGNVAYASKTPLNTTNGFITFGDVRPNPTGNSTFWGLEARLINLPFHGLLTQTITFSGSC